MNSVVNGKSETTLAVSMADIMGGDHAINVPKSATEAHIYVSCVTSPL